MTTPMPHGQRKRERMGINLLSQGVCKVCVCVCGGGDVCMGMHLDVCVCGGGGW